jgi:D-amino-acid dehydrogenase
MGKTGKDILCDAVVVCAGAYTSKILYDILRVFSPLTPVKGYTLEMDSQSPNTNTHLMFEDSNLYAGQVGENKWKIQGFGDLTGMDDELEQRRVRNFRNTTILHVDKKEGLKTKDIKVAMRCCSPDDLPVIGALKHYPNIYLNAGHGARSAALGISSSKLLSEILETGETSNPELPSAKFSPHRF